jgi:endonuclease YncB( thermonuclease family)
MPLIIQLCRSFHLVLVLLFMAAEALAGIPLEGRVVGVADGDTVTVLDADHIQHKIRLAGIDAPEKAQPFGNRAKESLSSLVFGQWVTVDGDKTDRYGRTVAKLLVAAPHAGCRGSPTCPRGVDANLAQINLGMAWWYRHYAREQTPDDRRRYAQAEEDAQAQRAGLWREPNPVPPWEWRKQRREAPPQSVIASPAMATTGRR